MDRWIPLTDDRPHADCLSRLLGLSPDTIMQIAKLRGLPLRRISRQSTPGVIQSEFLAWVKEQEKRK